MASILRDLPGQAGLGKPASGVLRLAVSQGRAASEGMVGDGARGPGGLNRRKRKAVIRAAALALMVDRPYYDG